MSCFFWSTYQKKGVSSYRFFAKLTAPIDLIYIVFNFEDEIKIAYFWECPEYYFVQKYLCEDQQLLAV
jgi:hypothetical protein